MRSVHSLLSNLGQAKKDERNAQFKIVSKRDSAIMPDKGYPGGWVNRAQERAEAAQKGEGWKSEA